jgi:hypothetical protein
MSDSKEHIGAVFHLRGIAKITVGKPLAQTPQTKLSHETKTSSESSTSQTVCAASTVSHGPIGVDSGASQVEQSDYSHANMSDTTSVDDAAVSHVFGSGDSDLSDAASSGDEWEPRVHAPTQRHSIVAGLVSTDVSGFNFRILFDTNPS